MKFSLSSSKKSSEKKPAGCVGVGLCVFSSIFIIIGIGVALSTLKFWTWKEVPCQIESFQITHQKNDEDPFSAKVRFTYNWEGQNYIGTKISGNSDNRKKDYEELVELRESVTRKGSCYLDKNNPDEAVLERSLGGVFFGIIFAAAGLLFFSFGVAVFRDRESKDKAISSKGEGEMDLGKSPVGYLFFGLFALAGTGLLVGLVVPTAKKYFAAKSWEATEATVIWSTVRSHDSDDGTTYSPDIFYRYDFEGERHRSNTFSLMGGSSSGYDSKKEVVESHPRGHQFTCYVNPKNPWQAVVKRKLGWWALFGLFPLPFMAVGFGGLWWMLFRQDKTGKDTPNNSAKAANAHAGKRLSKRSSVTGRWPTFIFHLVFALFWCGIVSIFLVDIWKGWQKGNGDWFQTLFFIPFGLIGLAALLSLPYSFLAIFSPRFDFKIAEKSLRPGKASKVNWKQIGGSGHLTSLTVTLVGHEEASYRQGTDRATAESIFYQKELFQSSHLPEMLANDCDLIFPADALPSFEGQHNQICWFLRLHGAVRHRPDVREEILLTLEPLLETDFR